MRITEVDENRLAFDNGRTITCDHCADCCERNYADFEAIMDDELRECDFEDIDVLPAEDSTGEGGFFVVFKGMPHKAMGTYDKRCWVPCYSEQDGYYTTELDVYVDDGFCFSLDCEIG